MVLILIVAVQLMFGIDSTVMTVALPSAGRDLGLDVAGQSWVQSGYVVAFGGLLLLGARLGDRVGRRRMVLIGVALFTVTSLGGGLAADGWTLIALRAAQGAGAALAGPNTMALLMLAFPAGPARNRALAVFSAVLGAGGTLGLVLGGLLTSGAGWRVVLLINVPIGVALLLLARRRLPETPRATGALDLPGIATSGIGVAALVLGLTNAAEHGWATAPAIAPLAAAIVLLAAFVMLERTAADPVLPLTLLRDQGRGTGYLAAALASAAMFGTFFLLTQFLQGVLHLSPVRAGLALVPLMGSMLLTVRLVPRLLARVRPSGAVLSGAILFLAGAVWLTALDSGTSYAGGILGPLMLLGVGGGLTFVPLSSSILTAVPRDLAGSASGALQALQYSGTAFGVAVLVALFGAARRAGHDVGAAIGAAMAGALFLEAPVLLLAVFRLRRERPATPREPSPATGERR
ncbi:MFS transporter [Actinoplanes sp. NPDC049265]|uniref:MFS transporter n=1 Tax=Actinoplanes sp. NPDC049265 TaxID=3363902 RepID=UPI00372180B7